MIVFFSRLHDEDYMKVQKNNIYFKTKCYNDNDVMMFVTL